MGVMEYHIDYYGDRYDPTAGIPDTLGCDRCGQHIDNLALAMIAFRHGGKEWFIAHKSCVDRAEDLLGWWDLGNVFRAPVMYTFRATMKREHEPATATPRALHSWFLCMEKITGKEIFHRTDGFIDDPLWQE